MLQLILIIVQKDLFYFLLQCTQNFKTSIDVVIDWCMNSHIQYSTWQFIKLTNTIGILVPLITNNINNHRLYNVDRCLIYSVNFCCSTQHRFVLYCKNNCVNNVKIFITGCFYLNSLSCQSVFHTELKLDFWQLIKTNNSFSKASNRVIFNLLLLLFFCQRGV